MKKRQSYGHQMSKRKLKFVKIELVSRRVRIKLLLYFLNVFLSFQEYLFEENEQSTESLMQLYQWTAST